MSANRMPANAPTDSLARQLILDEIFDLALYQALREISRGELRGVLDELIAVETRHVAFWQEFFGREDLAALDLGRRLKLFALIAVCRLFGSGAIHVVLEAIEVHGVRKYLRVWDRYKDGPFGAAVRGILDDEFRHEDIVVTGAAERRMNPDRVRNVFLGLNDGLVEILGAVSGFFAAFGRPETVLAGGVTVAIAGALSMAAGAYVAASSEAEVRETEQERKRFLGTAQGGQAPERPLVSALVVGVGYIAGALVPVLPVFFGATGMLPSVVTAGLTIAVVSAIVAFLSGMDVRRRVVMNLIITGMAVVVTYSIGLLAKGIWGISV
jgi:predicted membrane protein (TIGR00267 family)